MFIDEILVARIFFLVSEPIHKEELRMFLSLRNMMKNFVLIFGDQKGIAGKM